MSDFVIVPGAGDTLAVGSAAKPVAGVATDGGFGAVRVAGEIINGGRAIFIGADGLAYMADNTVLAEVKATVGISKGASALGAPVEIVMDGAMNEPTWAWAPGARLYFDNLGMLTTTAPATGHHRSVGVSRTATSIFVQVGEVFAR